MTRISIDHVCEDADCPHIGQRTFPGCKCHKTREQMLEAEVIRLRERLTAPAQSPKQCGESCEFFDMLWKWFEDESRIGADGMRPERHEGLSADDFKTMLDEHEAALSDPSTGLPAPAPHAEVREGDLYKLRDLIASHIACEDDCQKYPSGCGCALTAARAVQELGSK